MEMEYIIYIKIFLIIMIKSYTPNQNDKYKQGLYNPKNKHKVLGDSNKLFYRSSWEYKFCVYCDHTNEVIEWSGELDEMAIPYTMPDGSLHRYYPDFLMVVKVGDVTTKYVIEIKPEMQTIPPTQPKRMTPKAEKTHEYNRKEYIKNVCKWNSAIEYCKNRGMVFKIITEKDLFGK